MIWDKNQKNASRSKQDPIKMKKMKAKIYRGYTKVPYYRSSVYTSCAFCA
ncbi:MAG: hypothetical protein ACOX7H_06845 [Bacillota bacterium]|jgi:hypothetical protein